MPGARGGPQRARSSCLVPSSKPSQTRHHTSEWEAGLEGSTHRLTPALPWDRPLHPADCGPEGPVCACQLHSPAPQAGQLASDTQAQGWSPGTPVGCRKFVCT